MHYIITFLDIVLLSWFFWFPAIVIPIACYYAIVNGLDSPYYKWSGWPLTCLALVVGAALYRWPAARLTDWHMWLYCALGYVAAGFAVALYKWIAVLIEFRKSSAAEEIAKAKARSANDAKDYLERSYRKHVVESIGDTIVIYPDWRKHPIATWATYWPMFILSIPLDWLTHGIEWVADRLKDFWSGIARQFSVRG